MKAIAVDYFGAPPSLHDLPVPHPGESEVLVRVRASSVNGFDVAVAGDGAFGEYVPASEAHTARIPDGLDLATAGALGLAGTVEPAAIDTVAPLPGQAVLISGATGGVGGGRRATRRGPRSIRDRRRTAR